MPTITPAQRRVLDYLRGTGHVPAAAVGSNVYGSARSGTANALRTLEGLEARGLVTSRKGQTDDAPRTWAISRKGRRA
jgi:DNA-binding MarR family transcriptional regulator